MVQIKDSVLRDSGIRPAFPPLRSGVRISVMARRPFRVVRLSGIRFWKDVRTAFLTPGDDSDCQQLVNNLSRELYVVDFRRVVRGSKKVRIFRKIGLTFSKAVQVLRNIGTIQRASSKRGAAGRRGFPAETLLRP